MAQNTKGQLVVPHPTMSREEIQEPFVREQQIDPKEYYPPGYMPELLKERPARGGRPFAFRPGRRPLESLTEGSAGRKIFSPLYHGFEPDRLDGGMP